LINRADGLSSRCRRPAPSDLAILTDLRGSLRERLGVTPARRFVTILQFAASLNTLIVVVRTLRRDPSTKDTFAMASSSAATTIEIIW
jgi:hypothetical protein